MEVDLKLKFQKGSQSGKRLRLRGKGMSVLRSSQRGDMYVELSIETPTKLIKNNENLLEEFAEISGDDISPESANFFSKARRFWDSLVE